MVDLSIVIVSWNVADLLAACLDSILASGVTLVGPDSETTGSAGDLTVEVIVVDSASTDATLAVLAGYPDVQVLAQTDNVGFTRGNNIGLAVARGRHLMLLNPDTEVHDGALQTLVAYLDAHPAVGVVGPHTYNTDGTTQSTRRRFPTLVTALFESTWLEKLAPPGVLKRFYMQDTPDEGTFEVGWMQGSALVVRRAVYDQIGGLDEGYIMFAEEMDWCKRTHDAGWALVYVGDAHITHHGGKSTDQVVAQRHIYFQQSKVYYFHKHHGALVGEYLRVYLLTQYVWQLALEWLKGRLGHKPEMRRERVDAYCAVLKSGLRREG
jgi:N-acetylglucosaminyl-diphospho-decaprenol L-rhamnosyltransferase